MDCGLLGILLIFFLSVDFLFFASALVVDLFFDLVKKGFFNFSIFKFSFEKGLVVLSF